MRHSLISVVCCLLTTCMMVFTTACSSDDNNDSQDLYYIAAEIRAKVSEGIAAVSNEERAIFYDKLQALIELSNSVGQAGQITITDLLATEQYSEFRNFIITNVPDSIYLLLEIFLKGDTNLSAFSTIFHDIVETAYPGLISEVLDKLEKLTPQEFIIAYPQVCVEHLLKELE